MANDYGTYREWARNADAMAREAANNNQPQMAGDLAEAAMKMDRRQDYLEASARFAEQRTEASQVATTADRVNDLLYVLDRVRDAARETAQTSLGVNQALHLFAQDVMTVIDEGVPR